MNEIFYIYTLTDPIDKQIKYVGKTKDTKDRLSRHLSPVNLKESWTSKNKWLLWLKNQNLKPIMEVIDEGDSENIDDLEKYWISQFKTWGFKLKNETEGGEGCSYWTGKKLSEEHKRKTKMNNPLRRDVCQYEIGTDKLIKEYISLREASRETKYKRDIIKKSCDGKSIPFKHGVYWRYKDNYFPYVERDLKHSEDELEKMKMNHPLRKTICQYEIGTDKLIREYDSSHDVERETKLQRGHITRCCKGVKNYNTIGGYYWRFKDNYFPQVLSIQEHWNPRKK